ncbi:putative short-chain dehydrogenase [Xylariaceae sp. FL0016]|nr:putative short-chain dehydrogenase [Xylariaceae sp. FL0016]
MPLLGLEPNPLQLLVSQFTPLPYPNSDCTGNVVIVTGANVGLGLEAARHFTRLNAAKVILGCRDIEKGETAKADIEASTGKERVVEVWQVDLGSFESVKEFCGRAAQLDRLDVVLENAGVAASVYKQFEGYERQITVNVISTFLMALLLLPVLRRSSTQFNVTPTLVIVGSGGHFYANFRQHNAPSILEALRGDVDMDDRYNVSKLLELLITRELAEEMGSNGHTPVTLNIVNPGLCRSQLNREAQFPLSWLLPIGVSLVGRTSEMGSRTLVHAALADHSTHGKYLSDCEVRNPSSFVRSSNGEQAQKRTYEELLDLLEELEPGIGANV